MEGSQARGEIPPQLTSVEFWLTASTM
jgi:hypothetical protein